MPSQNHDMRTRPIVITLLTLWTANLGHAASDKLAPELQNLRSEDSVDVIVQYRQVPTEAHHRRILERGGELKHTLDIIRGAHYSISASQLEVLSNDPDVEFVSPDRTLTATANPLYTGSPDYGWRTVGADLAGSVFGLDGSGVGIALIDSGVGVLNDLKDAGGHDRVVYRATLSPRGPANDSYGHGDHVAGILAGNGTQSSGPASTYKVRGIAPNAHIVSFRVLDDEGTGTDSEVIAAIQQAIALKNQYNIRVINLSLGRPVTSSYLTDPLCQAVQQAWQAGIVVVVAAGNRGRDNSHGTYGYGTIAAPGNSPYVITVGAMNTVGTATPTDDKVASYSSKGPTAVDQIVKPDLVAPGNRVFSLTQGDTWFAMTYPGNDVSRSVISTLGAAVATPYYVMSGTSMAAPMVSGAAALMIQRDPSLTPDQVKARLMKTATKFAQAYSAANDPNTGATFISEYDIFTIGAGYLNITAALANNDPLTGPAVSPTATYDSSSNNVYLGPAGTAAIWGTHGKTGSAATWGTAAIWGTHSFLNSNGAIWGSGPVWGTAAIWGTFNAKAFAAIWGTASIWSTGPDRTETAEIAIHGDN
jgi:serine protease AprX